MNDFKDCKSYIILDHWSYIEEIDLIIKTKVLVSRFSRTFEIFTCIVSVFLVLLLKYQSMDEKYLNS